MRTALHINHYDAFDLIETVAEIIVSDKSDDKTPVAIAVVDAGGMLVAYLAMDGVLPAARQTAIDKAYTAIMFSRDTVELEERVKTDPTYRQMVQTDPRLTFWAGGVVLREHRSNWIVGALAVSGRKSDKDHELANAARLKQEATWRSK